VKEKVIYVAVGIVLGVVLAPQIAKLPGVSKLPTL
jgi:hypothetical protein